MSVPTSTVKTSYSGQPPTPGKTTAGHFEDVAEVKAKYKKVIACREGGRCRVNAQAHAGSLLWRSPCHFMGLAPSQHSIVLYSSLSNIFMPPQPPCLLCLLQEIAEVRQIIELEEPDDVIVYRYACSLSAQHSTSPMCTHWAAPHGRFLSGYKFDVASAAAALNKTLHWRKKNKLDAIR